MPQPMTTARNNQTLYVIATSIRKYPTRNCTKYRKVLLRWSIKLNLTIKLKSQKGIMTMFIHLASKAEMFNPRVKWNKEWIQVQSELQDSILSWLKPLHPYISIHILHTVLSIFPMVLTRRICLKVMCFFNWWSYPLFSWPST